MHTVVANPEPVHKAMPNIIPLAQATGSALEAALGTAESVLLHFSGYGYHKRGLCRWLLDGLTRWKRANANRRLVTVFHEVYATGPVWRSSFWTSWQQRHIAFQLAGLSDAGFVTSRGGHDRLRGLKASLKLEILPVFSNVGELSAPPPIWERDPIAVVFGSAGSKARLYGALLKQDQCCVRSFGQLGIERILDIGPEVSTPDVIGGRPVVKLGTLPASEVSEVLTRTRLGLLYYPEKVFTKSGIGAAYFSHGILVVNTKKCSRDSSDPVAGIHYIGLDEISKTSRSFQDIADSGHAWYRNHNVSSTVRIILRQLQ